MRVNIDWSEVDFKSIIHSGNNQNLLEELKNPDKSLKTKENYFSQKFYYFLQITELGNPRQEK